MAIAGASISSCSAPRWRVSSSAAVRDWRRFGGHDVGYSAVTMGGIETVFFAGLLRVAIGYTRVLR
jgi:hypothetical protein